MQHHTLIQMARELRLAGFADALELHANNPSIDGLPFTERLGMLFLAEREKRHANQIERLLRDAKLKLTALPEDLNMSPERGLSPANMRELYKGDWIGKGWNIVISGETGTGKTWLACSLGRAAIRLVHKTRYYRVDDLLYEISLARQDGMLFKLRERLAKYALIILDDFGVTPMTQQAKADLLQFLDDRVGIGSTIFVGQRPYSDWHDFIDDLLIADAILDRLSSNRHHIKLKGHSQRRSDASFAESGK